MGVDTRVVVPRNRKQTTIDFGSPNVSQIASVIKMYKEQDISPFFNSIIVYYCGGRLWVLQNL